MKTKLIQLVAVLFFLFGISSCKNDTQKVKVIEPEAAQVVYNSSKELVSAAKKEINQISPEQLKTQIQNDKFYIIDVREKAEYDEGSIPGSILIPRGFLEFKIGKEPFWKDKELKMPSKDQKIVVYCRSGGRGSLATKSLQQMGYTNVVNLDGGYLNWVSNYPDKIFVKNKVD
jgi:rhodanese-related sulfurtransferase